VDRIDNSLKITTISQYFNMKVVLASLILAVVAKSVSAFHVAISKVRAVSLLCVSTEPDVGEEVPSADVEVNDSRRHARPTSFDTKCATLYQPKEGANRGLAPPVYFGSTFLLDDAAHGARLHENREAPYMDEDGFVYSRWGSPTGEAAALQIAALEGVDNEERGIGATLLFNSGMSAITSSLMAVL
jgi:hypothetical protein